MRDYYAILRVARSASNTEIKAAYRRIALAVHPDVNKGDKARHTMFNDVWYVPVPLHGTTQYSTVEHQKS